MLYTELNYNMKIWQADSVSIEARSLLKAAISNCSNKRRGLVLELLWY